MYYGAIKSCDIANGEGVRVSLFVSGCRHACKNCFNPETWCFNYGTPYTEATTEQLLRLLEPSYIRGLTLIGGEPMEPENQPVLLELVHTGCVLETDLLTDSPYRCDATDALLREIDVLVDGPFVEEQKSLQLAFRGSANQRILRKKNGVFTEANQ